MYHWYGMRGHWWSWLGWLAVLIIALLIVYILVKTRNDRMMTKAISISKFSELYKSNEHLNILDVREDFEYEKGHIPGAKSKPLSTFPVELDKEKTYYVICQSGGRSAGACQMLTQKGYDVINVEGGMSAWRGEME